MDSENCQIKQTESGLYLITPDEAIDILLSGGYIDDTEIDSPNESKNYKKWSEKLLRTKTRYPDGIKEEDRPETWLIPESYQEMDVEQFLLDKCKTPEQTKRVKQEYEMFKERNLIIVLKLLIYLVDHFRENKYVWGVGRGSSVSSYCLYLIGIHKVDSIKYDLDINEFLK